MTGVKLDLLKGGSFLPFVTLSEIDHLDRDGPIRYIDPLNPSYNFSICNHPVLYNVWL